MDSGRRGYFYNFLYHWRSVASAAYDVRSEVINAAQRSSLVVQHAFLYQV